MTDTDMREKLHVSLECMNNVKQDLKADRKISAVKQIRQFTKCSLKEAKFGIERLMGQRSDGPLIVPLYDIVSVGINTPEGLVTVDLEGLQLVGLQALPSLGLQTCRDVLNLVDILQEWRAESKFKELNSLTENLDD